MAPSFIKEIYSWLAITKEVCGGRSRHLGLKNNINFCINDIKNLKNYSKKELIELLSVALEDKFHV